MDGLQAAVTKLAEKFRVEVGSELIAINARHASALAEAALALAEARLKLAAGDLSELMASDLRACLDAFGQVAGKVDNEKMLDRLFASFCIGK